MIGRLILLAAGSLIISAALMLGIAWVHHPGGIMNRLFKKNQR